MQWVRQWWYRRQLLRELRSDLVWHGQGGFRLAFQPGHAEDFYCSDPLCSTKHKVY